MFHLEHDIEKARKQAHKHQAEVAQLGRARGIAENEARTIPVADQCRDVVH